MSGGHAPEVRYLCDDPECCPDGCPMPVCRVDGQDWPCKHRRERDSAGKTARHERWASRVRGIEPRMDGRYMSGRVAW